MKRWQSQEGNLSSWISVKDERQESASQVLKSRASHQSSSLRCHTTHV